MNNKKEAILKEDVNFSVSNFDKMFGIQDDKFLTFFFDY